MWTVFRGPVVCGSCGARIPTDAPVWLAGKDLPLAKKLKRCADCSRRLGIGEVDWTAIDGARMQLEVERDTDTPLTLRTARPTVRVPIPRQSRPLRAHRSLADVPFDPKLAACGERD